MIGWLGGPALLGMAASARPLPPPRGLGSFARGTVRAARQVSDGFFVCEVRLSG